MNDLVNSCKATLYTLYNIVHDNICQFHIAKKKHKQG